MSKHFLTDTAKSGVYYLPPTQRAAFEADAERQQLQVLPANLAAEKTAAKILRRLGKALHFPSWYGANLDALYDCLTDPAWQPGRGHVLLLDGSASLHTADPEAFAALLEVFQAVAETHHEAGTPFWVLLDTPIDGITPLADA